MRLLEPCTELWGEAELRLDDPAVTVVRDGFYLPYASGEAWGLFHGDGTCVRQAVDVREGDRPSHEQRLTTDLTAARIDEAAPEGTYIYGGFIHPHFGHFLINTLPRFWAMTRIRTPNTLILYHGSGSAAAWFENPFVGPVFRLLGLAPRDFRKFKRPKRLPCVVVPATSLEEQRAGYAAFRALCRSIGERVYGPIAPDADERPVYYSKTRLEGGVGAIVNEAEIEAVLAADGVEIVHPETLSLRDQIALMARRPNVLGTSGSFLHTSIFCPPRRITCLNVTAQINTNYSIIDRLAGNAATYHYPPALRVLDRHERFLTARHLPDAGDVARELLAIAREAARAP